LRSYLEQAVALSDHGVVDLPQDDRRWSGDLSGNDSDEGAFVPLQAIIEEAERRHIQRAVEKAAGSVSKTAELLGISRKTLWEKMKRLKVNVADTSLARIEHDRHGIQ
jgi:DNA-binding NtrC family response regulator